MTAKEILELQRKESITDIFAMSCALNAIHYEMGMRDEYKDKADNDDEVIKHAEKICETVKDIWCDYDSIQMGLIADRVAKEYFNNGESIDDIEGEDIVW